MSEPKFSPVDMQTMMDDGVLMAANETFFWPLGLALTWTVDDGKYEGELHIREWVFENGHLEDIALADDDEVGIERRARFSQWLTARLAAIGDEL